MNLSRRNHEEERADRLGQWKEAFTELHSLGEDERSAVQTLFSGSIPSNPPPTRVAVQEVLEETPTFDTDEMEPALDRITSLIDDLSNLRLAYEARSSTPSTRAQPDDITQALQHVSELERLYETVPEPLRRDVMRSPPEEEETSVLDEKLEEVIPEEAFRETKRQRSMTEEEGDIIRSVLGLGLPGTSQPSQSDLEIPQTEEPQLEVQDDTIGSTTEGAAHEKMTEGVYKQLRDAERMAAEAYGPIDPEDPTPFDRWITTRSRSTSSLSAETVTTLDTDTDMTDPMDRLDQLIRTSPEVKRTYDRALAMPTPSDHDACMELVTRMGVPVIKAGIPYEAEGLASSLARAGLVDFVGTEDSDVLAYEVSLHISGKSKAMLMGYRPLCCETYQRRVNPSL